MPSPVTTQREDGEQRKLCNKWCVPWKRRHTQMVCRNARKEVPLVYTGARGLRAVHDRHKHADGFVFIAFFPRNEGRCVALNQHETMQNVGWSLCRARNHSCMCQGSIWHRKLRRPAPASCLPICCSVCPPAIWACGPKKNATNTSASQWTLSERYSGL